MGSPREELGVLLRTGPPPATDRVSPAQPCPPAGALNGSVWRGQPVRPRLPAGLGGGSTQAEAIVRPQSHTDETLQGEDLTGPREPNPTHSSQRRLGTGRQPGSSSVPAAGGAWMPSCLAKVPDRLPPGVLCTADSSAVPHPITCPSPVPIKGGVPVSMITPFYLPLGAHRKPQ